MPSPCDGLTVAAPHALLEQACFKYALSKTLGYAIVVGSAGVKLPQVVAIVKSGGVHGLSPASILIEMAALVSSFSYYIALGYPFSTWGEKCVPAVVVVDTNRLSVRLGCLASPSLAHSAPK